jgi:tetratricopeptide (TPR) repeat protein
MSTSPYLVSTHIAVLTDDSKSQLALQYTHSIRDASPQTFVFWVHASTRARFDEAYRDLADRLQLPGRSDPKANVLQLVSEWLRDEANGRWVMVLDNVDDVETFYPSRKRQRGEADADAQTPLATYLPQSRHGAILVTSRSKDAAARLAGGHNKTKEVLAMDEGEGLQLLRNKLGDLPHEESAVELLRALDCIPLAISQAAAYISRRARMTVAGYLDEFWKNNKKRESLLNWDGGELRRDESASNSVVTTWQMSFEQIQRERGSAAELLSLMSFFNPQGIPESTLRRYNKRKAEENAAEADAAEDEDEADSAFDEDLDTLQAYSLVSITTDNACEMLSSFGDAAQWEQRFVVLMAQELPSGEYENWAKCQQLLPHVESLFENEPAGDEALKAWAQVLNNAAWYLWMQGSYSTAQQVAAKALAAREGVLGVDAYQTVTSVVVLALVLQYQGKYEEAETLNRRALEGYKKELGEWHPNTLTSMSNLALVLHDQGKYEEAETHIRRALEGYKKELGERHPYMLTSMDNLAGVLRVQGKYEEAETLSRRALEGRKKELGERHPHTLMSMDNLAGVLRVQGKYEEAETLNRRALEGWVKELGERHPNTLTSVNNLVGVLEAQGKYEEAETLSRRALEGRKKELGECHPNTLTSMYCLAYVLHTLRRYTEAAELYQQACDGRAQQLGPDHPHTIACRNQFTAMQQEAESARFIERRRSSEYTESTNSAEIGKNNVQ